MCWNVEFSLLSCAVAWTSCLVLWNKGTPRSKWYGNYLVTYTFTQLVDIILWLKNNDAPLSSCPNMVESFKLPSDMLAKDESQMTNLVVTKYVLPLVVFTQYWQQLSYPSDLLSEHRTKLKLLFLATSVGMGFQFGCTDIVIAKFPQPHETLRWGGVNNEYEHVMAVVAITTFFFWLLMDNWRVKVAHTVTFWSVVGTLYFTEGTLALGSKWCTYCLIFSFVYLTDHFWNVPEVIKKSKKKSKKAKLA